MGLLSFVSTFDYFILVLTAYFSLICQLSICLFILIEALASTWAVCVCRHEQWWSTWFSKPPLLSTQVCAWSALLLTVNRNNSTQLQSLGPAGGERPPSDESMLPKKAGLIFTLRRVYRIGKCTATSTPIFTAETDNTLWLLHPVSCDMLALPSLLSVCLYSNCEVNLSLPLCGKSWRTECETLSSYFYTTPYWLLKYW